MPITPATQSTFIIKGLNSRQLVTRGFGFMAIGPTTATLSGPTTGKMHTASTNFTVTLDAPALSPLAFYVTYAGGTVSGSPVIVGTGLSSATFTVTPTVAGPSNVVLGPGSTGLAIAGSPISYLPTASLATLTGPPSGPILGASSPFIITLDAGAPAGGVSCPVSSSVGGDTVTTSPVAISAGLTTGTFTVTASGAGLRNISLNTTTPSLTIAGSPIAYLATSGPSPPSGGQETTELGIEIYPVNQDILGTEIY